MSWYLLADGNLYKAERTINAPGWSLDENTPRDQPVHGWTWYEDDDAAMLATGLTVSITARLDRIDPPRTPEEQVAYEAQRAVDRAILDATAALMEQAHTDGQPWEAGGTYKADDLRTFGGIVYRCIQPHTNYDPGHTPNLTPALWTPQG